MEGHSERYITVGRAHGEVPCPIQRSPAADGPTRAAARLLLIARKAHLAAVDEDALHLRLLVEDRLVADDDVRDLAALERAELAVDAEDPRRVDGRRAQGVVLREAVLDGLTDAAEVLARLRRTADECEEDAVLCQHGR